MYKKIDSFNKYIPNSSAEIEAEKHLKEIVEVKHSNLNITDVGRYDLVYGEMRLIGKKDDKDVYIKWNYFNGDVLVQE